MGPLDPVGSLMVDEALEWLVLELRAQLVDLSHIAGGGALFVADLLDVD